MNLEEVERCVNTANASFTSNGTTATAPVSSADSSSVITGLTQPGTQSQNSSFSTQLSEEKPGKSKELSDRRTDYGIAWIIYMRFARRAETLQSARAVFGQARKDRWTPWEVYEAAGRFSSMWFSSCLIPFSKRCWSIIAIKSQMLPCAYLKKGLNFTKMRSSLRCGTSVS